jgi:hypothetical protein
MVGPERSDEARPMIRSKLLPLALLAVALACGGDLPAAFLHVEAEADVPALDALDLRFLAAGGGDAFHHESVELGGTSLSSAPYTLRVEAGSDSPFAAPTLVSIAGLVAGVPVASWTGTVDLSARAEQTVRLTALSADCDADHDGAKDCTREGCCTTAEAPFADCNDASTLEAPLADEAGCRACADTDGDTTSDCLELAHEPPCDPQQAAVYPGATEVCDTRDNDCDGETDEGQVARDWDGHVLPLGVACGTGACAGGTVSCVSGQAACSTASLAVTEIVGDAIDNDCNGATDEGGVADDTDGDGFPDAIEHEQCDVPWAELRAEVHPGAAEPCCAPDVAGGADALARCDLDCDGAVAACGADDADHDGYATALDCDDADPTTWPGAPERCGDGADQDCDGADAPCTQGLDQDGDQYTKGVDCDDARAEVHPGADERCNGGDDDCDGLIDEGNPEASQSDGTPTACGTDEGECEAGGLACRHAPGDDAQVVCLGEVPAAAEACNAKDDDCDGDTDEDLDPAAAGCLAAGLCATQAVGACRQGAWTCPYAEVLGAAYEAQEVTCDTVDNDCDGATDEGLVGPALSTCKKLGECAVHLADVVAECHDGAWSCGYPFATYQDDETRCDAKDNDCDGDTDEGQSLTDWNDVIVPLGGTCGTGACAGGIVACDPSTEAPACSTATLAGDETCDAVDDDCDGLTDEGQSWQGQALGTACDGIGACGVGVVECLADASGTTCSTNPDGSDPEAGSEACNLDDDDCDGVTDEGLDASAADSPCRRVGVCSVQNVQATCAAGQWSCSYAGVAGYEAGAETSCDGKDNDCDGKTDEDPRYADPWGGNLGLQAPCEGLGACGEGVVECGTDHAITCSSNPNGSASAAMPETCNGADDDCDGATDEGFAWAGLAVGAPCNGVGECGDGQVECLSTTAATCSSNPEGSAADVGVEVCNLLDDDCDGVTDDGLDATSADATCRAVGVCTRFNVVGACIDGAWSCDYSAVASYDVGLEARCDGLDNDCDGDTDEDFAWHDPATGTNRKKGDPCGSGACDGGVVICLPSQVGLACSTDVASDFEVCDGKDNDCDGLTDEGLRYTDPITAQKLAKGDACNGLGTCGQGVVECGTALAITCSTNPDGSDAANQDEVCDDLDNDCDGATDEELAWRGQPLGAACDGPGACGAGVVECSWLSPVTTCSTAPDGSEPGDVGEACNGVDDDCDDVTDEGLTVADSPCRTTGACTHELTAAACITGGAWQCDYSAVPGWQAGNEQGRCDGVDNDCDGATDEDFPSLGQPCDGDDADKCAYGAWVCASDHGAVTCHDASPATEACGGLDEDCDGLTDEPGALGCEPYHLDLDGDGYGRTGDLRCQCGPDAATHYTAAIDGDCDDSAAGSAINPDAAEPCNGLDDDCDGLTDAADPDLANDDVPACEVQLGVCAGAVKPPSRCDSGAWLPCGVAEYAAVSVAFQAGSEASCDALDNDCDGTADEDFSLTLPDGGLVSGAGTACGTGACAGGHTTCNAAKTGITCPTLAFLAAEMCGGGDDDCDGLTDAADPDLGPNDHPACEVQVGACQGATKPPSLCTGGAWHGCGPQAYAAHAATYQAGTETSCDGVDNDCDAGTDEDFSLTLPDNAVVYGVGTACGTGRCTGGTTACNGAKTGIACSSLANLTAELCGGGDDDCDGKTDAADPDLAINDAPACEKTAGVCTGATKPTSLCVGGAWQVCTAAVYLARDARYQTGVETSCDGADNDCDGAVDDDFALTLPDGTTIAGAGKACGTGACAGGTTACDTAKTGITCPSLTEATAEICDGDDNDCDGKTDAADADLLRPLCAQQDGVCKNSKPDPARCVGGAWGACSLADYTAHSASYQAGTETAAGACDGLDNNCNNQTDESYVASATTCGTGACARTGTKTCVGGAERDSCTPGLPAASDATCDLVDDDCSGATDEDFPAGPSTCGLGACARTGVKSCTNGVAADTCVAGVPAHETCNGTDDDCDGATDAADADDVIGGLLRYDQPACAEQDGVCHGAVTPARLCSGGSWQACDAAVFLAHAATYQAGAETSCDAADNDCDGAADEDFSATMPDGSVVTGVGAACGYGACTGGVTLCSAGHDAIECSSLANLGSESCGDGDEDCDGMTDEFLGTWSSGDLSLDKAGGIPSMAAAPNGTLYAAWQYDPTSARDLYLGENPGSGWTITPLVTDHAVGAVSAVVVTPGGDVHVIYADDDASTKALRVVSRMGGTWGEPADIEGGGASKISVGWVSGRLDATQAGHVAYYVSDADRRDLHYATNASGDWVIDDVEAGNVSDLGMFASLRIASTGEPRIAYADASAKLIRYAAKTGGSWTYESVTAPNSSTSYSISLALDEDDVPIIAYWDLFMGEMVVARRTPTGWVTQTVETGVTVGQYGSSLDLDPDGTLHLAYHVINPNADLHYATADAFAGPWTATAVDTAGTTGRYPYLVLTPTGRVRVVHGTATTTLRLTGMNCP